jgi:hypothetical protein
VIIDQFAGDRQLFWVYGRDRVDYLYFSGAALWNYLTFPALLLRDDIACSQISENALKARFSFHLPTHSAIQHFHFDPTTRLLRQHDYTANVVLEHNVWDGIPFPSKRRVTPRAPDGTPRSRPVLIWIDINDWTIR